MVADQGRAGVGDECDERALDQAADELLDPRGLVVLVQRDKRRADAELREQLAGMTGVLGRDQYGAGQRLAGAIGEIAAIADRGRDDEEGAGR